MRILSDQIQAHNQALLKRHTNDFAYLQQQLEDKGIAVSSVIQQLRDFQVAIPSWALGAGGTRFGRFSIGGEPANLEQKMQDAGLVHSLSRSGGAISLHIPWDVPEDYQAIKALAKSLQLQFDAVNSNTFQDQVEQVHSYKFGSLSHVNASTRQQAIDHNLEVIEIGEKLGSKALTVWLADGASFPGQNNLRGAFERTKHSLQSIYQALPEDWKMFIEYKPYEPHFYSTVIQDWGTSYLLASELGEQAYCLVDLGHHLPNTNIEQIVATLHSRGKLGGFHFNDSKYGDDDLTVGSIKPYQLFLIFQELLDNMAHNTQQNPPLAWMIDASHTLKDPLEDLMQSLEAILIAYAQALIVDQQSLQSFQNQSDVVACQEALQDAFRTDVRPLVREARIQSGGAIDPIAVYRELEVRKQLIRERGTNIIATGL